MYGLDEELLAMVPQPVKAVVMLFPITPTVSLHSYLNNWLSKYEEHRIMQDQQLAINYPSSLFFVTQTIPNACGTIALLHAILNNLDCISLDDGVLRKLYHQMLPLNSTERARVLQESEDLSKVHQYSSTQGQSDIPNTDADVDLHFICFVEHHGRLYELDGRKKAPVDHGNCGSFLHSTAAVVKEFMNRDPGNINFTLMGLCRNDE